MRLVPVGKIIACHGVRGVLRARCFNPPPSAAVSGARTFWVGPEGGPAEARAVETVQPRRADVLVRFAGIGTHTAAAELVGRLVSLPEEALPPLGAHEFYYHEVVGFQVRTIEGAHVGTIRETFFTGSHDVWVVGEGAREHLIPVIADVVRSFDRATGTVVIEAIEGLLSDTPRDRRRR
jgi:16S rRNA processing protein RimM